jgi:hypothetical protein
MQHSAGMYPYLATDTEFCRRHLVRPSMEGCHHEKMLGRSCMLPGGEVRLGSMGRACGGLASGSLGGLTLLCGVSSQGGGGELDRARPRRAGQHGEFF